MLKIPFNFDRLLCQFDHLTSLYIFIYSKKIVSRMNRAPQVLAIRKKNIKLGGVSGRCS